MSGPRQILAVLNGAVEPGRGWPFWALFVALVALAAYAPAVLGRFDLLNLTSFLSMGFLAVGLALIWGFSGILSLGQSAFFGIGGYAFGIAGINLAAADLPTNPAVLAGLAVPALAAALLGYIMFYARLRGVYVAIMMLVTTLAIETFLNQTAGAQWKFGVASLGGNNGLGRLSADVQAIPSLSLTVGGETIRLNGRSGEFYYLILGLLVATYLGLRYLVNSSFGVVLAAVREDPERAEQLGYDIRRVQLVVFTIGAVLAGLSGLLYVSWGNFITPSVFGVTANIVPVIWVAVAGRKSLLAAILGAVAIQWATQELATMGQYALVVQGLALTLVVMLMPDGLVSMFGRLARLTRKVDARRSGEQSV